ncbi:MAG: 3-hydroxyacyl-CoA dehydrogenase NAD-binding domain-containing protein [Halobacteriaceae archaeon]
MDIETITVLGAGTMGHGIAEVAALGGFDVRMRDIDEELVEEGHEQIEWSLGKLVDGGQIDRETADAALERVEGVVDLEAAVEDTDFVIEAVPERMEVKKNVYRELDQFAPDRAVFATNTSSLSVTEISEVTDRPERCCGMHFFNPPVKMKLVEVIAGAHTAEDTLETTEELAEAFGKAPIRVRKDTPGFVVNRVLVTMLNEAAWMVHGGEATVDEIDSTAAYEMGLPQGAFELTDRVGVDVVYHVLEYMRDVLGDAYDPCPLIAEKVEAGDLGRKTGRGFYDYEDGAPEVPADEGSTEIARRLRAVMANEVAKLVGEDVADVEQIDRAMRLGAHFSDGPASVADEVGLDALHETLVELREETGAARYEPAAELETRVTRGVGFYATDEDRSAREFDAVRVEVDGDVGRLVVDREHRMNTLTADALDEVADAVEYFEEETAVRALLVTGAGERAFSAGADVQAMTSNADPVELVELMRKGQRTFGRLESSPLPVVAGIDGYCLGGGMELAAACDLRVAGEGAQLGQPEHDLGLMPGWGGTQRLPRIVGEGRAKEIIFTADRYDAATMAEYGFLNEVAEDAEAAALDLARDLAAGPPIAQRYTKRAIHAGRDGLDAGLEVEANSFGALGTTDDLMEGVTAFASDREPEFEGK